MAKSMQGKKNKFELSVWLVEDDPALEREFLEAFLKSELLQWCGVENFTPEPVLRKITSTSAEVLSMEGGRPVLCSNHLKDFLDMDLLVLDLNFKDWTANPPERYDFGFEVLRGLLHWQERGFTLPPVLLYTMESLEDLQPPAEIFCLSCLQGICHKFRLRSACKKEAANKAANEIAINEAVNKAAKVADNTAEKAANNTADNTAEKAANNTADKKSGEPVSNLSVVEAWTLHQVRSLLRRCVDSAWQRQQRIPCDAVIDSGDVDDFIEKMACKPLDILITGETGTGKEVVARKIAARSGNLPENFVAVNCAAIPKDLFEALFFGYVKGSFTGAMDSHAGYCEQAHKGILFLDEIGDMPLHMQAKLLRVLQERKVQRVGDANRLYDADFRLICATHCNLKQLVEQKLFREDLYYRICTKGRIRLKPLHERDKTAAESIVQKIFLDLCLKYGVSGLSIGPDLLQLLTGKPVQGNIRGVAGVLELSIAANGHSGNKIIDIADLPEDACDFLDLADTKKDRG